MGHLILKNHRLSFEEIKNGNYRKEDHDSYENHILDFCGAYLNKKPKFQVKTSGSTGKPKEILVNRYQMLESARLTAKTLRLTDPLKALLCINAKQIGGLMMLVRAIEFNWDLTVVTPNARPYLLGSGPFDFTSIVPLQLAEVVQSEVGVKWANQFKVIIVGGASVALWLEKELTEKITVPTYHTFGMTETISHLALRRMNGPRPDHGYITLEGVGIKTDLRGCLALKSIITANQWVQSNDLVEIVDANSFIWLGRHDQVINSGGHKIIPEVLEQKLASILFQLEWKQPFFVAGIADPKLGQKVALYLEGEANSEIRSKIRTTAKLTLHPYEYPRTIRFIDRFSRTKSNKIDRKDTLRKK